MQLPGTVGRPTTAAAQAAQWFSQELFNDPALAAFDAPPHKRPRSAAQDRAEDSSAEDSADDDALMVPKKAPKQKQRADTTAGAHTTTATNGHVAPDPTDDVPSWEDEAEEHGFEVVADPTEAAGSSDSEDEFEALDDDAKAEIRALAKRMLRGKERWSLVEAAYNKHAFNDEALPRWFEEDQRRHAGWVDDWLLCAVPHDDIWKRCVLMICVDDTQPFFLPGQSSS